MISQNACGGEGAGKGEGGRGKGEGKTHAKLTRQIKMPQYLLVDAQGPLVHPRRDPLVLFAFPIPFHLRLGYFSRFLLRFASYILCSYRCRRRRRALLSSDRERGLAGASLFVELAFWGARVFVVVVVVVGGGGF